MSIKKLNACLILLFILIQVASAQKFDAEVIKYTTLCEVEKDKLTQTDSITIQINNRVGDEYTEISIPYSKNEKVSDLDAWIENMNGTKIRGLKKSDIVDKSAISDISLYEDNFDKCFQLKHNEYPYKVIYTYKTTYRNYITIASWTPILYRDIPTRRAMLKIILPKNFSYNKYVNNISDFRIDSTGTRQLLEWKAAYDKPIKSEIYSQPDNSKPYVRLIPLHFQYGVEGSSKDWQSYGNWQLRLIQDLDILPDAEKSVVSGLINGIKDKKEIVKILYHYLQDRTRYINVDIGIGGMKPYPAAYVAQNKYGDCKALTNYMKAMLSFAGIESFYTIVYASEQPHTYNNSFVGPLFNHVVLAVPVNNDTIWLENTANTNPFGYMGTSTQNRFALLTCSDHSRLVHIPALKTGDDLVTYKLEFDLNLLGSAVVKLNISFKGQDFEAFNQLHSEFNDNEKDRIVRDYMPFDNYEVVNWELKKLDRDTARIVLNAKLNLSKFLKPLGGEYYFSIYPCRIPAFTPPAARTLPVVFPYPICNSDTLIYNLPVGYELKSRVEPILIKTRFGTYEQVLSVENGKVVVIKRFELFPETYSLEQYPDIYSFIQSVKDVERRKIIIKPINKTS
jgi:hypothetical protein